LKIKVRRECHRWDGIKPKEASLLALMTSGSEDIPPQGELRMAHMVVTDSIYGEQRVVYSNGDYAGELWIHFGAKVHSNNRILEFTVSSEHLYGNFLYWGLWFW
jgi:hypothetical protein